MPFASRASSLLSSSRVPWAMAAIAALVTAPALDMGLIVDDYVLRGATTGALPRGPTDAFRFVDAADVPHAMDIGVLPWWTAQGFRLAFFRPLASLSHWVDFNLLAGSTVAMHAISLVWVAATAAIAALLYRRLLGRTWFAGLAALCFALDPGHSIAAGWIASRNAVLAAFFGLSAVYAHDRARRGGDRRAGLLAPLLTALSLASGEPGVGALALLGAHALTLEPAPAGTARLRRAAIANAIRALAPHLAVALAWIVYYAARGYGTSHSAMYRSPLTDPAGFLKLAATTIPINVGSRLGGAPPQMLSIMAAWTVPVFVVSGLAFIALAAWVLAPALRREPTARFLALAIVLAALPIAGTSPQDRNLFFVGFAGFGLVALVARRAVEAARPRIVRPYAAWLVFVAVGVALPAAPYNARATIGMARLSREPLSRVLQDDAVREQTVVFVNPPTQFFVSQIYVARAGTREPVPAGLRTLVPGMYPTRITRLGDRALAVHVTGGILPVPGNWPAAPGAAPLLKIEYLGQLLASYCRGAGDRFVVGDVVRLAGWDVRIDAATADGGPTDMTFTFDRSLDDPQLRWLEWRHDGYVPFAPPRAGESVELPAASMATMM